MIKKLAITLTLALACTGAQADRLLIDEMNSHMASSASRPSNGLSKADVESRFGAPETRYSAVGDPPIARWDYSDFVVYFEYDLVIHSVAKPRG